MQHALFIYSDTDQKILDLYDDNVLTDSDIAFSEESLRIFARGNWYSVGSAQLASAISVHNSAPDSHQDIRNIIDGMNTSLVFDSDAQISAWLAGTYQRQDNVTPQDLVVGNRIYTTASGSSNYIVSQIPVSQLSDLKVMDNSVSLTGVLRDSNNLSDVSDRQQALNNLTDSQQANPWDMIYIDASGNASLIQMPITYGKGHASALASQDGSATANNSIALGEAIANGSSAVAIGRQTKASGSSSYALSFDSESRGNSSGVFAGAHNVVTGNNSALIGTTNKTLEENDTTGVENLKVFSNAKVEGDIEVEGNLITHTISSQAIDSLFNLG